MNDINIESINIEEELRIVFMGTPDFAVPILEGLIDKYNVKAVVTQPDKPVGRGGKITESPIKKVAKEHMILVEQPINIKEDWQSIVSFHPNLIITCAYGQIIPRELLVYPKYGCINVHASLLPKLRGGAPIHRAIINGHKKTGITIMYMSPRMDEGDMIAQEEIEITDTDTASTLHDKLSIIGRDLLLDVLPKIQAGIAPRIKQNNEEATYGYNISKEDEKIDFNKNTKQIYNQIRGLNAWPGAYCIFEGKRLKVWESKIGEETYSNLLNGQIAKIYNDGIGVKVENGEIIFTVIQPEGKGKMLVSDYLNGIQNKENLIGKIME